MPQHKPNDYAVLVEMRTSPTILVEGVCDCIFVKQAIYRFQQRFGELRSGVIVDSSEAIDAPKGARLRVEKTQNLLSSVSKFAALVDREFRGFSHNQPIVDRLREHRVRRQNLYWTRGHSIENYILDIGVCCDILATLAAEKMPYNFSEIMLRLHDNLCKQSLDISLWAKDNGILGILAGNWLDSSAWVMVDGKAEPNIDVYISKYLERGGDSSRGDSLAASYKESYRKLADTIPPEDCRWMVHGHLGMSTYWSGVAFIFGSDIDAATSDYIARGASKEKLRIGSARWFDSVCHAEADLPPWLAWLLVFRSA